MRGRPLTRLAEAPIIRHCERSEAIQKAEKQELDCFVAALLAMTALMGDRSRCDHYFI